MGETYTYIYIHISIDTAPNPHETTYGLGTNRYLTSPYPERGYLPKRPQPLLNPRENKSKPPKINSAPQERRMNSNSRAVRLRGPQTVILREGGGGGIHTLKERTRFVTYTKPKTGAATEQKS